MSDAAQQTRRSKSPRGEFEASKQFATQSENARREQDRRKSELLKSARLATNRSQATE